MLHASIARPAPAYAPRRTNWPPATPENMAMVRCYRGAGGLVTGDRAATLLAPYRDQPISQLARWIIARHIVSFDWEGEKLVPLFQFELAGMSLKPGARQVISELAEAFEDDLEVAAWFTRPSRLLDGVVPLVMLEIDQPAVLQAARAEQLLVRD